MLALIQRVARAEVRVDGAVVGAIGNGLLALVAVEPTDGEAQALRMCDRLFGYRVFADGEGKMNRSLTDTGGSLLLVSQFTLAADTRKGMRAGFSVAADPEHGLRYYNRLVEIARERRAGVGLAGVETGRFGAHMEVELVNDGPVTFLLKA
jgi:D-tyrosyl-tRNA(Tyr) deacylase